MDATPYPEDEGRLFYKGYSRFSQVALPPALSTKSPSLQKALFDRRSERSFAKDEPLALAEVSQIILGLQINSNDGPYHYDVKRAYPSAGACYPLEAYILPVRVTGLKRYLHHYHVRTNSLEELWPFSARDFKACFREDSWCMDVGMVVVLTACHTRGYHRFRERAYQYCLLEAGQAAQNVQLLAAAEGLNSCSYGGFYDEPLMRLLDINPNEEIPLLTVFIGKPLRKD